MKIILKKDMRNIKGEKLKAGSILNLETLSILERDFYLERLKEAKVDGFCEVYSVKKQMKGGK